MVNTTKNEQQQNNKSLWLIFCFCEAYPMFWKHFTLHSLWTFLAVFTTLLILLLQLLGLIIKSIKSLGNSSWKSTVCCYVKWNVVRLAFMFGPFRIPDGWTHIGRVSATENLELTFALKQQNVDRLEELLKLVSDPDSAQYGRNHLFHPLHYKHDIPPCAELAEETYCYAITAYVIITDMLYRSRTMPAQFKFYAPAATLCQP